MKKRLNVLVVLLMLVALLGSTSVAFAEGEDLGTWVTKSDASKTEGTTRAVEVNGKIYVMGQNVDQYVSIREYNPETDTWATKASMPSMRVNFGLVVANGKIYTIGGDNRSGKLSTVEEYDPSTDTWSTKANMSGARSSIRAVALNEKIYVTGGSDANGYTSSTLEEYNVLTDTWTTKASLPEGRYDHAIVELDGKIYVIGGSGFKSMVEYDSNTDTWTTKASLSTERAGLEAVAVNQKIYAISGGYLETVEEYSPLTNSWRDVKEMSFGRTYFGSAVLDNKVYVIGGNNSNHPVEVFTPPTTQQPPESPTNLTATAGDSEVSLSWDSVTDATSYTVKKATTSGGPYTTIVTDVTITNYTDTDVTNGTTYYYVVTATVNGTETDTSNEASATPQDSSSGNTGDNAILIIKMVDGTQKEYDLTMTKVNDFIDWYEDKDNGSGNPYYTIEKNWNQGPFDTRKDYIIFSKICYFEINEY